MKEIPNLEGYEVLIYMSDQHTADCAGFMGDKIAITPNLDKLAEDSFIFDNAYTTCPLCVPARASFMTGRLASNIGVFDNASDFKSGDVTFAHSFALKGYETNLIGRMHFVGMDYNHGFIRRIGTDMTNSYWGCPAEKRKELGDFGRSLYQKNCLELIGSGDSPILAYDREVVSNALEFFSHDYDKPQMTVVGTYAPHFSYVASEEKMNHFREKLAKEYKDEDMFFNLPPVDAKVQKTTKEDIIELRAAYYAMVETMDEQIGLVYSSFKDYLLRNKKKGVFIYMSDHGDQLGCMGIYGKQTFFEKSARIPLLMHIDDFKGQRIESPVSIMEVGQSLCDLCRTESIPLAEGNSFAPLLNGIEDSNRYVISEFYDSQIAPCIRGYMVFKDYWKYIVYEGFEDKELLFDLSKSRDERTNLASIEKEVCKKMRELFLNDVRIKNHTEEFFNSKKNHAFLDKVGSNQQYLNKYLYCPPENVRYIGENCKRVRN